MLLRKIIISVLFAFLIGLMASNVSFDFDNYLMYVDRIDVATDRFANEPIFPAFLFLLGLFEIPSELVVKLFTMVGVFLIVYALIEFANKSGKIQVFRSVLAITFATPFIVFSAIVPRQGLATGLVLMAMTLVAKNKRFFEWITICLLLLAAMTHNATALLGLGLLLLGYMNVKKFVLLLVFVAPISLVSVEIFYPDLFSSFFTGYDHYVGNMRETGFTRLILFFIISAAYLMLVSWRVSGYFSATTPRNHLVVISIFIIIVVLYLFVATDAIRLSYVISIVMIAEVISRLKFGFGLLLGR